jgi:hypothetical protein
MESHLLQVNKVYLRCKLAAAQLHREIQISNFLRVAHLPFQTVLFISGRGQVDKICILCCQKISKSLRFF